MAMAKLEVWPLELQGFAIVSTETAERLRLQYEPYVDIEQTPTWVTSVGPVTVRYGL
jgi:hypothetical protein